MPIQWKAKAAAEVIKRDWVIPVADDDSATGFTASASGVTIDAQERSGETVTLTLSAGTNGATGVITLTATTARGETLNETAYLPIRAKPNAFTQTIAQVLSYALRPIVGIGNVATADEQDDARETLDDILASWAEQGADLQVKLPTDPADVLYVPDYAIGAMKAALRVRIAGLYGKPTDVEDFRAAQRGLQQIKQALVSDRRENEYY
jgi:hypothetical protein